MPHDAELWGVFEASEGNSCYDGSVLNLDSPDVSNTPSDGCQEYAGGFVCAGDPQEYCADDGSCTPGCGYVNDEFLCFSLDENGDGVPDSDTNGDGLPDIDTNQDGVPDDNQTCDQWGNCQNDPNAPTLPGNGGVVVLPPADGGGITQEQFEQSMDDSLDKLIDPALMPDNADGIIPLLDNSLVSLETTIIEEMGESYEDQGGEAITADDVSVVHSTIDKLTEANCVNPTFDTLLGTATLDICDAAAKAMPILNFAFVIMTIFYTFFRLVDTVAHTGA